jgi:predicted nuclease with TOPRIM domain
MHIENKQKEDERYLKLIDELQDQNTILNERLDKKDERIIELEDRCAELRNKLDEANTNLAKASLLKCTRLACDRRKPPLGYTELSPEEMMAEGLINNQE